MWVKRRGVRDVGLTIDCEVKQTMAPLAPGTMVGPLDTSTMAVERFEDVCLCLNP